MDQTAETSEQSQGSEAVAADTTGAVKKEMLFFNAEGWKESIIVTTRAHSIIIFWTSSRAELSISILPACVSHRSGGTKESSERPRPNLRLGIQSE